MNDKMKKVIEIAISLLFWLFLWLAVSFKINNSFLFPSPKDTVTALVDIIKEGNFFIITLYSFLRIIVGIIIGVFAGTVLGVITASSRFADILMTPAISTVKATPVASFIILVWIWFDSNVIPILITALIVLPVVYTNVIGGIRSVSRELLDVAKVYKFSFSKRVFKLYVPTVLPYFLSSLKACLGMAWKAGIAAEVLCVPTMAIGTELFLSKSYLEMPTMFAWTLVVIIFSLIIEKILIYALSVLTKKCRATRNEVKV